MLRRGSQPAADSAVWNSLLSHRRAAAGNVGGLCSLLSVPLTWAAPPPGSGGSETTLSRRCSLRCAQAAGPLRLGSPCPFDRRFAPIFSAGSPRACRGSRGAVAWWARLARWRGSDPGGRSVSEGGTGRWCARGVRTNRGPQERLHQSTGPRHLGLPAHVTSDRHVRIAARLANCPISPKTTQSTPGS